MKHTFDVAEPQVTGASDDRDTTWSMAASHASGWCSVVLLTAITGALITQGFDGLAYPLGFAGSAFLWASLVGPLMAATPAAASLPSALATRFDCPAVGTMATAVLLVALIGLVSAEFLAASRALGQLMPTGPTGYVAAMAAINVGLTWSIMGDRAAVPLTAGLIAFVFAVLLATLMVLTWQSGPGGLIAIPQMGDIAGLEQTLLEKRLADPATFKPHGVAFLRTDALNFSSLVVCLSFGLALLIAPRSLAERTGASLSPTTAARTVLLVAGLIALLPPLAAAAKRALLSRVATGLSPAALPSWMQAYLTHGDLQICGVSGADAAAIAKACGKGVGPSGFLRWHDLAFSPDALLLAALDAASPGALAPTLLITASVVLAVVFTARRVGALAASAVMPFNSGSLIALLLALVACSMALAFATSADPLTLFVWSTSFAASALAPTVLAALSVRQPNPTAAIAAMLAGGLTTAVLILASSSAPVALFQWLGPLSSAPTAVARKLGTLHDAWTAASDGPGRDALLAQATKLARDNLNCLGLKPLAFGIIGLVVGTVTLIAGQLVAALASTTRGSNRGRPNPRRD